MLTLATLTPTGKIAKVLDQLDAGANLDAQHMVRIGRQTLLADPRYTMRQWMVEHDGQRVDTLQLRLAAPEDNPGEGGWAPLRRRVNAHEYAGSVLLDESHRYYRGMSVLKYSPSGLIVRDDWHVILFTVSETNQEGNAS